MTYDVVPVSLAGNVVRLIETDKDLEAAECIVDIAAMRRGTDSEWFTQVPHGTYKGGRQWKGGAL